MRRFYKLAAWTAIAGFAAVSVVSCDDDETENTPKLPTLELGTVNVTADYEAAVTVTPSKNAISFSWGYAAATAEPESYTKVDGHAAVEVRTPSLTPGSYKIFAYAENKAGRSEIVTKPFEVTLDVPTVKFGEITASRAGITIPLQVSGAAEFTYALAMQEPGSTTEPAIPNDDQFRTLKTELLDEGNLIIEPEQLSANGTWHIFAYAENEKGKGTVTRGSVVYDETKLPKLVEFEILNMTAWSLDVNVKMLDGCEKYAVGAYRNGAYTKRGFISSAKTSITPDSFYPLQTFNVATESRIFPEKMLLKNTLASSDESEGMDISYKDSESITTYQIAVYAVDKEGNGTAYVSEEFSVPAPAFGQTPTVNITAETDVQKIHPTFTVEGDCAKLYTGRTAPSWYDDVDWTNEAKVVEFLASIRGNGISAYEGKPLRVEDKMVSDPNTEFIIYAIPITADGKVGKLCYKSFRTELPAFEGTGSVDIEFESATANTLTYSVWPSDNAKAVRIVHENKFLLRENEIPIYFYTETNPRYVEYTMEELNKMNFTVTFENLQPDNVHFIRAVTVDADGKMSPIQSFPDQRTLPEGGGEITEIDFSKGKGEVTFTVVKEDQIVEDDFVSIDLTYKVEKGANTVEAYKVILSDIKDDMDQIEAACKSRLDPNDLPTPITFGAELTQTSMVTYDAYWGGSAIAIVTKDTDGNFKIAYVYFAKAK